MTGLPKTRSGWSFGGDRSVMGHPVEPNTDGMPTNTYFRTENPTVDSYAEILGKYQAPLVNLSGTHRSIEG